LDNVNIGLARWSPLDKRCPHFKYAGKPDAWHEAFFSYLRLLKSELNKRGFVLVVNHNLDYNSDVDNSYWDVLYNCTDGMMGEQTLSRKAGRPWYSEQEWLTSIKRHEGISRRGLIDWWAIYSQNTSGDSYDGFLYTYCSWLLVRRPGLSYYYASRTDKAKSIWYEEYELPIGEPISGRYERSGCWFRDFVNAKVVVNPSNYMRQITIDNNHSWYDVVSKVKVKELTVPPCSGRILLASPNTGGQKPPMPQ
jgi:hypothetical protein